MPIQNIPKHWVEERKRLRNEILDALHTGTPVNLSRPKHSITAPVLRELSFDSSVAGRKLSIVFLDGTKSPPFQFGLLAKLLVPPDIGTLPRIRLGLMSFRHPELDYLIDCYVTRNLEIVEQASMADEEAISYRNAVVLLSDAGLNEGAHIEVYHTGLEPMVVGFYRGVAEVLCARQRTKLPRTLVVTPHLYNGKPIKEQLGPDSPGAKAENYIACEPWY